MINDVDVLEILKLPILVVLDEAYIEFSHIPSKMDWVKKHENLIVLRTFSKRAGYAKPDKVVILMESLVLKHK